MEKWVKFAIFTYSLLLITAMAVTVSALASISMGYK